MERATAKLPPLLTLPLREGRKRRALAKPLSGRGDYAGRWQRRGGYPSPKTAFGDFRPSLKGRAGASDGRVGAGIFFLLPALAALASFTALASPSLAATHEWRGYTHTIAPAQAIEQEMSCSKGALISGGYTLDNVHDGPFSKVVAVANAPVPDDRWRVGFYNDHDAPVRIDFRISILCD